MKIFFDTTTLSEKLPLTGIPRVTWELGNALKSQADIPIHFVRFTPHNELIDENNPHSKITIEKDDCFFSCGAIWNYQGLLKMLENEYVCHYAQLFHDTIPILFPHFYEPGFAQNFKQWCSRSLNRANTIITLSNSTLSDLRNLFPSEFSNKYIRSKIVQPGMNILNKSNSHEVISTQNYEPFMLCVGTLESRKNLHFLLDCFKTLKTTQSNFSLKLVLVGQQGWLESNLIERINFEALNTGDVYHFANVSDKELSVLYQQATFTIMPSLYEGFGLPVLESLAYGTPCVASDIAGLREIEPGLVKLLPPSDLDPWCSLIYEWSKKSTEYQQYKEKIKIQFRAKTWQNAATELLALLSSRI